jgi:hypothetical protein
MALFLHSSLLILSVYPQIIPLFYPSVIFQGRLKQGEFYPKLGCLSVTVRSQKKRKKERLKRIKKCCDLPCSAVNYLWLVTWQICFSVHICSKYKWRSFPKYFSLLTSLDNFNLWQILGWYESVSAHLILWGWILWCPLSRWREILGRLEVLVLLTQWWHMV